MATVIDKEIDSLSVWLDDLGQQKIENEADQRLADYKVRVINAKVNLLKASNDLKKVTLEEKKLMLEAERFTLEKMQAVYNMSKDLSKCSDKIQRAISKTVLGLFPEEDKQVLRIIKAAEQLEKVQEIPH